MYEYNFISRPVFLKRHEKTPDELAPNSDRALNTDEAASVSHPARFSQGSAPPARCHNAMRAVVFSYVK